MSADAGILRRSFSLAIGPARLRSSFAMRLLSTTQRTIATRRGHAALLGCVLVLSTLSACSLHQPTQMEVQAAGNRLFAPYLTGDVATARQSLHQTIQFFEQDKVLVPSGRASILYFDHARLYALEMRTGDEPAAEAALVKARYWNLRRYELNGGLTDKVLAEFRSFNAPEKLVEVADLLDKNPTAGKGPKYLEYLAKR